MSVYTLDSEGRSHVEGELIVIMQTTLRESLLFFGRLSALWFLDSPADDMSVFRPVEELRVK